MSAAVIRAVLIDLDGTLVDTLGEIVEAVNVTLREAGREPVSTQTVAEAVGEGAPSLIAKIFGADEVDRRMPDYMRHYHVLNGSSAALYPNVEEGLARMHALGLSIACVTNKPSELVRPLLESLDVADQFDLIVGGGDVARKKPHPDALLFACERFGVEPAAAVMVGDSQNDALAAHAGGLISLTVPYGYPGTAGAEGRPEGILARGITRAIVPDLLAAAEWIAAANAR